MLHVIFVLLVFLYINVIEAYFVSSLGSEALQTKINTNVTDTIGDTHVIVVFLYQRWREYIFYIKMEAKNKSEEYLQIATFHPPELNREATLTGDYLTGGVSVIIPSDESDEAILTFNKIQCMDDTDYICCISYDTNGINHKKQTISTSITVTNK